MSLNLKAEIDPDSGFCFGVVKAVEMAEAYLNNHDSLYCLGEIVHNEAENERLRGMGLKIISPDDFKKLKNTTVMIRAHGEPPSTYAIAAQNSVRLIDASCPVVLKLQKKVRHLYTSKKQKMYIFGKPGHAEVKGLSGQIAGDAVVFRDLEELKKLDLPDKLLLVCQTTMDTAELEKIKSYLFEKQIDADIHDTICRQVSNRSSYLSKFVKKYDKIVFASGKNSSNGRVLYETCLKCNPNSFFVSTTDELRKEWFEMNDTVGICGATSTPVWLMQQIKKELENF